MTVQELLFEEFQKLFYKKHYVIMELELNAKLYRTTAKFIEDKILGELTIETSSELGNPFIPVIGDLQYFPQPASEAVAAQRGFRLLRIQLNEVVAMLYAIAAAAEVEKDKEKLVVLGLFAIRLQPYVDYFRKLSVQKEDNTSDKKTVTKKGIKSRTIKK